MTAIYTPVNKWEITFDSGTKVTLNDDDVLEILDDFPAILKKGVNKNGRILYETGQEQQSDESKSEN